MKTFHFDLFDSGLLQLVRSEHTTAYIASMERLVNKRKCQNEQLRGMIKTSSRYRNEPIRAYGESEIRQICMKKIGRLDAVELARIDAFRQANVPGVVIYKIGGTVRGSWHAVPWFSKERTDTQLMHEKTHDQESVVLSGEFCDRILEQFRSIMLTLNQEQERYAELAFLATPIGAPPQMNYPATMPTKTSASQPLFGGNRATSLARRLVDGFNLLQPDFEDVTNRHERARVFKNLAVAYIEANCQAEFKIVDNIRGPQDHWHTDFFALNMRTAGENGRWITHVFLMDRETRVYEVRDNSYSPPQPVFRTTIEAVDSVVFQHIRHELKPRQFESLAFTGATVLGLELDIADESKFNTILANVLDTMFTCAKGIAKWVDTKSTDKAE